MASEVERGRTLAGVRGCVGVGKISIIVTRPGSVAPGMAFWAVLKFRRFRLPPQENHCAAGPEPMVSRGRQSTRKRLERPIAARSDLHERVRVVHSHHVIITSSNTLPKEETSTELALEGVWRVVVLNDPVNLMSYVVMVFKKVFGFDESTARQRMLEVHEQGRSIVWSGLREKAEAYVFTLQQWHLTAVLEPDHEAH